MKYVSGNWNAVLVGGLLIVASMASGSLASAQSSAREGRGFELFEKHCALCHGSAGRADGPAAYLLFPPAREFTLARFKLASTTNGVPTEDDLVATLRRGMPGSAMPSWSWMDEDDLHALAQHVRELAVRGVYEELRAMDPDQTEEELRARARRRLVPGPLVPVGATAAATPAIIETGRKAFVASCATCHGEDGKGRKDVLRPDEDGVRNWARDFTAGVLKGGASHEEIAKRLQVGIHGTAMPATALSQDQRLALITYVRHLIPTGAEDRLVQRRETIFAPRVDGDLAQLESAAWEAAPEVRLAMAPLWWKDGAVLGARVAALHDGETLALRIRWQDASADGPKKNMPVYADAVAVQLSTEEHPAFFGMGHRGGPTNIWHWRAMYVFDAEDMDALVSLLPHRVGDWLTGVGTKRVPFYQFVDAPLAVSGETVAVRPAGMRVREQQEGLPTWIAGDAAWADGEWRVVLRRALEPSSLRELPLRPGTRTSINFAIWDGALRDLRGQKSVTIWHELAIQE